MNTSKDRNEINGIAWPRDPFAYIAFWQFLTFIILLLLIWLNEIRDLPAFFFNGRPEGANIFRGCILSAGVFLTAMMAIGNTYIQQKRVLNALISVCASCHRVRIHMNEWKKMEDYVSEHSLLTFTHGLCPVCMAETMQIIEKRQTQNEAGEGNPAT